MSSIQFGRAGRDFAFAEVRAIVSDADGAYGFDSVIPGGVVDLERAAFRTPGINVQIVTTLKGRDRLIAAGVNRLDTTEVTVLDGSDRIANGRFVFSRLESLPRASGQGLQPDGLHFHGDHALRRHHRCADE
jgi:hypothetical protein